MKRKISLLLCILTLSLCLTGCVEKENVAYDASTLETSCEQFLYIVGSEQITAEYITGLSEWNQGYLMASLESQIGVQMEADTLVTAIQGWEASKEECGQYVQHGDYTFKATSSGVTVVTPAVFSGREADLEFTFDENLELESFTVSAKYSTGEILKKAGLNTVLGMGTVFAVLIFMSFIISSLKYIPMVLDKFKKKEKTAAQPEKVVPQVETVVEEYVDDTELIAVIAAAIAAEEGTSTDGFVVRSIKRRKSNKWNA